MAAGWPQADRAVQVIARHRDGTRWLGSGYLVTGDMVITAQHVVADADRVTIRLVDAPRRVRDRAGRTVWAQADIDLAVVRLPAATPGLAPVRYGRLTGPTACEAVGYPWFKLRDEDVEADAVDLGAYRDSHHVRGTCMPGSNRRSGTLELAVTAPRPHPDPERSAWEGMSGAAVFADGALIAILTDNFPREGPGLLAARPVEQWYTLPTDRLAALRELIGVPSSDQLIPAGAEPAPPQPGRALPRDTAAFTGRTAELEQLTAALDEAQGGVLPVFAVDGMAGAGKSAFAIHAAHRLAPRFPDGQVFLPLHAHTPGMRPVSVHAALATLLLGDGLDAKDLREDTEARAGLWRERTAARRMLLVLDDAADSAQVTPLLPAAPGTLVLVTSRRRLDGLEDVIPLPLGGLPPADATTLIVRLARRTSLDATDSQIAELADICGFLPLALSICAARLASRPSFTVTDLLTRFASAKDRLGALTSGERSVAAVLELSYQDLDQPQRQLLRLLGTHPGNSYEPEATAALLDTDAGTARTLLDALEGHRLLDETAPSRYRMHDLVHKYAADTARHDPQERDAALTRLLEHYATRPQRPWTPKSALAWLRAERENLLACIDHARRADNRADELRLSTVIAPLLDDMQYSQAVAVAARTVELAREFGDRKQLAVALMTLGRWQPLKAEATYAEALELYRQLGDRRRLASTLIELGQVRQTRGGYAAAADAYTEALELYRQLGSLRGQAIALRKLGWVRWFADGENTVVRIDRFDTDHLELTVGQRDSRAMVPASSRYAEAALAKALELYRQLGDLDEQADVLHQIGRVRWFAGDEAGAAAMYREEERVRGQHRRS
jgi:tetratricopeptide (TPR) repeat protein